MSERIYIGDVSFVYNGWLGKILKLYNFIFKKSLVAITNPFTQRVHIISYNTFNRLNREEVLYKHEYIHVLQIRRDGALKFVVKYLLSFVKRGFKYNKIDYEVEAYKYQWNSIEYIETIFKNKRV